MQKKYNLAFALKVSTIAYSVSTVLFFMLLNLGAGFLEAGNTGTLYAVCVVLLQVLVYVELFGYLIIMGMAFAFLYRKNKSIRLRQKDEGKFPMIPFIISMVFFMIFMSLLRQMGQA